MSYQRALSSEEATDESPESTASMYEQAGIDIFVKVTTGVLGPGSGICFALHLSPRVAGFLSGQVEISAFAGCTEFEFGRTKHMQCLHAMMQIPDYIAEAKMRDFS
ncbi:hypothetical protein TRIATDRAFT_279936 [Trichoderma atroviride IMI 206040]|uniref:Uncharacterized protein n=1 Tax=Hypocrea atroviridis (strain ATCC 20476 / IMI 206040) TaxID=452589 RepID=G9NFB3_HYPAI|nr:uncharacterized protein TRIATDRAFT_279936 [Trichoderma atroviride IMI 206040]EHK50629.1 hypothetical protein TRIATDRAFT_279936 [Trichoderma atroviride IMI 206040]